MKLYTKQTWTILAVLALIFMCGCTGGGPDEAEPSSGDASSGTTIPSGGSGDSAPESSGGVSFDSILGLGMPDGYVAEYEIEFYGGDEIVSMTQKHYITKDKIRMDMAGGFSEEMGEVRTYSLGEVVYSCTQMEGDWICMKFEAGDEGSVESSFDLEEISESIEDYLNTPAYAGTRNIAGIQAQCFKVTYEGGSSEYCLHPRYAIPLYMESADKTSGQEGYYKMTATSFTAGAPADSVFELPAEAMDMEDLMNQALAGMEMPGM